jgi:hypothetical protein
MNTVDVTIGAASIQVMANAIGVIKVGHWQLCHMRDDGRIPTVELIDDIAAYESILNSEDAPARARTYLELRHQDRSRRPREIARLLGWIGERKRWAIYYRSDEVALRSGEPVLGWVYAATKDEAEALAREVGMDVRGGGLWAFEVLMEPSVNNEPQRCATASNAGTQ